MESKTKETVSEKSFKMVWKLTELAELKKKKASLERQIIRLAERIALKEKEIQKLNSQSPATIKNNRTAYDYLGSVD